MSPIAALTASSDQVLFFYKALGSTCCDPLLQLIATVFDFTDFYILDIHCVLDAGCGKNG